MSHKKGLRTSYSAAFCCVATFALLAISSSATAQTLPLAQPGGLELCDAANHINGTDNFELLGKDNWLFENEEFADHYNFSKESTLPELAALLRKHGSELIIVPVPPRPSGYSQLLTRPDPRLHFSLATFDASWDRMVQDARAVGLNIVNLRQTIQRFQPNETGEAFFYPSDHHWTTSGARAAAVEVGTYIQQLAARMRTPLQPQSVKTIVVKGDLFTGSYGELFAKSCGRPAPKLQSFNVTVTPTQPAGLLDEVESQIAVFGDSFGQAFPDNNFVPWLESITGLSTINYSVSGGGPALSIEGYLADPVILAHLPKFLVLVYKGGIEDSNFDYGLMLGAVQGCQGKTQRSTARLTGTKTATLSPFTDIPATARKIFHLHTSIPVSRLDFNGTYSDGSPLNFQIYRTAADFYKGSRTDYYAVLDGTKQLVSGGATDGQEPVPADLEICNYVQP